MCMYISPSTVIKMESNYKNILDESVGMSNEFDIGHVFIESACGEFDITSVERVSQKIEYNAEGTQEHKYFYYYINTNELRKVSKKAFKKGDYPVIVKNEILIKLVGLHGNSKRTFYPLFHEANKFKAEGLCRDFIDAASLIKDIIQLLASSKRKLEAIGSICDLNMILSVVNLLLKLNNYISRGINVSDIIITIIDIYTLVVNVQDKFKAEMLEEICLASISMLLPNKLFEIVKRINVFSSSKLSDDVTGLHKIFTLVVDAIICILDYFPNSFIVEYLKSKLKEMCKFGIHAHLYTMNKLINEEKIGEKLNKIAYRTRIKEFNDSLDHGAFLQWSRKSASVSATYQEFLKLTRRIKSYEESARQEPIGIVFQGPPGCGKSRAMNAVIQCLPWSRYVHTIKDVNDGKDFYDMYENETIFYMDDVGQQGISQWRSFINMISEVKYPLDCAKVENKDTKFFNSEVVMATTNEFMGLSNLTKNDCISDISALWRRCVVLDFKNVTFNGSYSGFAVWKYYDINKKKFEIGFPPHFSKDFSEPIQSSYKIENDLDFYAWICKTIFEMNTVNKARLVSNRLTDSQLEYVRDKGKFMTEGFLSWNSNKDSLSTIDEENDEDFEEDDDSIMDFKLSPIELFKNAVIEFGSSLIRKIRTMVDEVIAGKKIKDMAAYFLSIALVMGVCYLIKSCGNKKSVNEFVSENNFESLFSKDNLNTFQASVVKNLKEVTVYASTGDKIQVMGLLSGHCILLPSHAIINKDSNFITVYYSRKENHILYDKLPITVAYLNREEDVAIVKIPNNVPTIFRKISKAFKVEETKYSLLSPFGGVSSCNPQSINKKDAIVYKIPILGKNITNEVYGDHFLYPVRGDGLCGSLIAGNSSIRGMHVAGNQSKGVGLAIKWKDETLRCLHDLMDSDCEILPFEISEKVIPNSSVIKLNETLNVSVSSNSNFGSTPLFGIFPVTRFPAQLTKYGKCTVKDIAKKSFGHTTTVSISELNFGKKVVDQFLFGSKFRLLSEEEIVKGNNMLAGLNKKSSNGFNCKPLKSDYIDFDKGVFKSDFLKEIEDLENGILNNVIDWKKFVWVEALKDELRNCEKEGVPRSFRVGTIHHQVLMKKWFGWLVEHLMFNRKFNNIMVGINPFVEWPFMYDELRGCKGVFAGDIAKWDGSMNNMVQDAIKEVILRFIPEKERKIPEFLLEQAIRSIVAVQDDLYITTHSMPSGHYLTAILNSLVNRFYTAMWYEREVGDGSVMNFIHSVVDYVYGDDKLVGIKKNEDKLHAISMEKFFTSMNMGFTDSLKNSIADRFQDLSEVTFLKRYFRYHDELGRIVCPLELRTLQSGLSYYDVTKDLDIVLKAKIDCYQREVYLWPERDNLLQDFYARLKARGFYGLELSKAYLKSVYLDPSEVALDLSWGGTQYL